MAFLMTSRLFIKQLIQSEKIFKNIVKVHSISSNISDKYLAEIKQFEIDPNVISVTELLTFPSKTFYAIDKKSLECIIHNSFNIIKEKGLATTREVYKSILKAYLFDRIEFDVENLLKDMSKNGITLDKEIYNYIVRYYCNNKKMRVVESFLSEMKCKGIDLDDLMKSTIVSAYTAAEETEKLEIFIRENQLEPNGFDVLFSKCYGFACIGDVVNLKRNLFEIQNKQFPLTAFHCKLLYSRILSANNVDKSSIDQIIDLTKDSFNSQSFELYLLISRLNTENNFATSLYLIKKINKAIKNSSPFILLFTTPRCPPELFMEALKVLINQNGVCSRYVDMFANVTIDKAFEIATKFCHANNWKIIYYSLFHKAIKEKSLPLIEKCLDFSFNYLPWHNINTMLQESVIRLLLDNGIVSNYEEILDLFPKRRNIFGPVILMEYICMGEFNRYNELRSKNKYNSTFQLNTKGNYLSKLLMKNFSNQEIKGWIVEARKSFKSSLINQILSEFVVFKIIYLTKKNSSNEIEELFGYLKEWNIKLLSWQFYLLLKHAPVHSEVIQSSWQTNINN